MESRAAAPLSSQNNNIEEEIQYFVTKYYIW